MDYFYIIVSVVLIVLLIIILTYIGIVMQRNIKNNTAYPPKPPSKCPDYWNIASNGSCNIPKSTEKNGGKIYNNNNNILNTKFGQTGYTPGYNSNSTNPAINFEDSNWNYGGSNAICNQKNWANTYNIVWDGVTNFNGC